MIRCHCTPAVPQLLQTVSDGMLLLQSHSYGKLETHTYTVWGSARQLASNLTQPNWKSQLLAVKCPSATQARCPTNFRSKYFICDYEGGVEVTFSYEVKSLVETYSEEGLERFGELLCSLCELFR